MGPSFATSLVTRLIRIRFDMGVRQKKKSSRDAQNYMGAPVFGCKG